MNRGKWAWCAPTVLCHPTHLHRAFAMPHEYRTSVDPQQVGVQQDSNYSCVTSTTDQAGAPKRPRFPFKPEFCPNTTKEITKKPYHILSHSCYFPALAIHSRLKMLMQKERTARSSSPFHCFLTHQEGKECQQNVHKQENKLKQLSEFCAVSLMLGAKYVNEPQHMSCVFPAILHLN